MSARVQYGYSHSGSKPYLQCDEEEELSSHLLSAASIGLGKTRHEIMRIPEVNCSHSQRNSKRQQQIQWLVATFPGQKSSVKSTFWRCDSSGAH